MPPKIFPSYGRIVVSDEERRAGDHAFIGIVIGFVVLLAVAIPAYFGSPF